MLFFKCIYKKGFDLKLLKVYCFVIAIVITYL